MNRPNKALVCASGAVLCWATVASAFKIALAQTSVYAMLAVAAPVAAIMIGYRCYDSRQMERIA